MYPSFHSVVGITIVSIFPNVYGVFIAFCSHFIVDTFKAPYKKNLVISELICNSSLLVLCLFSHPFYACGMIANLWDVLYKVIYPCLNYTPNIPHNFFKIIHITRLENIILESTGITVILFILLSNIKLM